MQNNRSAVGFLALLLLGGLVLLALNAFSESDPLPDQQEPLETVEITRLIVNNPYGFSFDTYGLPVFANAGLTGSTDLSQTWTYRLDDPLKKGDYFSLTVRDPNIAGGWDPELELLWSKDAHDQAYYLWVLNSQNRDVAQNSNNQRIRAMSTTLGDGLSELQSLVIGENLAYTFTNSDPLHRLEQDRDGLSPNLFPITRHTFLDIHGVVIYLRYPDSNATMAKIANSIRAHTPGIGGVQ